MRILGIEIDPTIGVKAIELEHSFGRSTVNQFYDLPFENPTPTARFEDRSEEVQKFLGQLSKKPDRIVVSIPLGNNTFRKLKIPAKDKKSVQAAVGFELEDELPFPMEDTVFDYTVTSQGKQGSNIYVDATLKHHLGQLLFEYQQVGIQPDIVTTEAWAYRALMNRVLPASQQGTPALLVHLKAKKTVLYLHLQEAPEYVSEVNWGAQDLEADINCRESLVVALRQIEILTQKIAEKALGLIYLTGEFAKFEGIDSWIESRIKIPTRPLPPWNPNANTASGSAFSPEIQTRLPLATGLALSMATTDRVSPINFRKGEFSKSGKTKKINFKALKKPLMAASTVAISLILSLVIQSSVYQSRLQTVNSQLEKSIKSFYGQISGSAIRTYLNNPAALRASVKGELDKEREVSRIVSPNPYSPLDFLSKVSAAIPKGVTVDLVKFQAGIAPEEAFDLPQHTVSASLSFHFPDAQTAEKLTTALSGQFADLKKGKLEEMGEAGPDEAKKWKITFTGTPIED